MMQHVFHQIWAQRKYNTWIFIELMIVFVLVWIMMDYAFVMLHNKSVPQGFDYDNTYMVSYGVYDSQMSRYDITEDDSLKTLDNLQLFVNKIKAYDNVEVADLTYLELGSIPFSGSCNQTKIDTTDVFAVTKNIRSGSFFQIFRYTSSKDNSWEYPAGIDLNKNNALFITRKVERECFGNESAIGKTIKADIGDGKKEYRVADVLNEQKRFDYTLPQGAVFGAAPDVSPENIMSFAVCLRTKEGISEQQFISNFTKEMTAALHIGNFYLKEIKSFHTIKKEIDYFFGITNEVRTRLALMLFFLLNIALGIIGTFWFRNQARRGEIGLRMAVGSSRRKLQMQFIMEALLLFTLAVFPAILINLSLVSADLIKFRLDETIEYKTIKNSIYIIHNAPLRFTITTLCSYFFLTFIVCLSAWIPAGQASKIHPVEALKDE